MDQPLPQFNTSGGKAFVVVEADKPDYPLYAFIHEPSVPIRHKVYASLAKKASANVVCPVARGIMNVTLDKPTQRLVTIFERPMGEPLFTREGNSGRLDTSKLRTNVALSLIKAIAGLHKRGIIHGSINPARMYFVSDESDDVYLGECLTTPTGLDQDHEMEPIEIAFADPEGRGEGTLERDFFQFGASIMALYFAKPLASGRDKMAMLMARVNQSSFWALSGGQDVPGAVGQLLKGVMLDDIEDRWGFEDVLNWYEGSVPIKRSGMRNWTMSRPTNFKGISYVDRRLLATALAADPKSASVLIRGLDFEQWMSLCLRDEIYSEGIHTLLGINAGSGMGHDENNAMVSRFAMFLHPLGPVRYKELTFNADALPAMVALYTHNDEREKLRCVAELINKKFMTDLFKLSQEQNPTGAKLLKEYAGYDSYARSPEVGKGIERILYDLNPGLPCLSIKFDRLWTVSVRQLLGDINRLAGVSNLKNLLLDRHIAAYLLSQNSALDKDYNKLLGAKNDQSRFNTMSAEFFALLQRRFKGPALPALTNKLVDSMSNAIKGLKNRKTRDDVTALFEKVRHSGDLEKLMNTVNLTKIAAEDSRKFMQARNMINRLDREKAKIPTTVTPADDAALSKGYGYCRNLAFMALVATLVLTII